MASGLDYILVALIGTAAAYAELISRFRDEPGRIWRAFATYLYLGFNAAVSVVALVIVRHVLNVHSDADASSTMAATRIGEILGAGVGALAIFRSNFSLVRIGDKELALNVGIIITSVLDMLDRQIDRNRGEDRLQAVSRIMQKVDFDKACATLPVLCLTSLQAIGAEESRIVGEQVAQLAASNAPGRSKSLALGMLLMNVVGETILKQARETLGIELER